MKNDPVIAKALRLAVFRKFPQAIRLLEGEAVRYQDSFRYYYILGVLCLRAGDFGGAFTYFSSARRLKKHDPGMLLGMAALYLRRGDTVQAVEIYLQAQEFDPGNRTARKALNLIRRRGDTDNINAWVESGSLKKLYPPLPRTPFALAAALLPVFGSLLVLFAAGGILSLAGILPLFPWQSGQREGYEEMRLLPEERNAALQTGGSYRYVLTRDQINSAYDRALRLFLAHRDEEAKVELNRILESNAPEALKNRARQFLSSMGEPGFDNISAHFDYPTVIKEPILYRDCYVIWEGMATNISITGNATVFNLLVGYDTRTVLQGIVRVDLDFALAVNTTRPLKVLGRVVPVSTESGIDIHLQGVTVQQPELPVPAQ